jgi:hypothetical protein
VSLDTKADPMNASPIFTALPVLPAREGSTENHRDAHALAEAGAGWRCAYCPKILVDTCALEVTPTRDPDEPGGVYVIPQGYDGVRIHHGPRVLACGTCIGRKSAEKSAATRAARKAGR